MENKSIKELEKIKKIINVIINLIDNNIESIKCGNIEQNQQELLQFLIGNKESVVSIITKLSNILLKLGLLEKNDKENTNIDSEDIEIIKKYLSNN